MRYKTILAIGLLMTSTSNYAASEDTHHYPGIFLGATTFDGETNFSYALEYEYKFSKLWGAGLTYEKTDDAHHGGGVDIALASVYLHPWKELRLGAGYGKGKAGGYTDHEHHEYHAGVDEEIFRTSISYDFHVGGFGVAPTFAVDFIEGETATVLGVAFIKPF